MIIGLSSLAPVCILNLFVPRRMRRSSERHQSGVVGNLLVDECGPVGCKSASLGETRSIDCVQYQTAQTSPSGPCLHHHYHLHHLQQQQQHCHHQQHRGRSNGENEYEFMDDVVTVPSSSDVGTKLASGVERWDHCLNCLHESGDRLHGERECLRCQHETDNRLHESGDRLHDENECLHRRYGDDRQDACQYPVVFKTIDSDGEFSTGPTLGATSSGQRCNQFFKNNSSCREDF